MPENTTKDKEKDKEKEKVEAKKEEALGKEEPKGEVEAKKEEKPEKSREEEKKAEKEEIKEEDPKERKISILFKRKPTRMLLLLLQDKKWYPSLLARESGQSYVHASKTIVSLEDIGLVSSELNGKKRIIKLTEKGEKLVRAIEEVTKSI